MTINHSFANVYHGMDYLDTNNRITIHQSALFIVWIGCVISWIGKLSWASIDHLLSANAVSPSEEPLSNAKRLGNEASTMERGDGEQTPVVQQRRSLPPSATSFFFSVSQFGLVMLVFYLTDYKHLFPKGERVYSRDLFLFLSLMLLLSSWYFTNKKDTTNNQLLNRQQTDEWRGWMQVMFVWYHYYRAAEIYNSIRIFIAAYVWMTGFGNFSYFWIRKDFSLYRLLKMLWRLNFLVIMVCLVTNNSYMLYYICAMHTFWFLSVYLMMRPCHELNTNKYVMATKFTIYAIAIAMMFDAPGFGDVVFYPFKFILGFKGSLHEWLFRAGLDHYCTLVGMLCAYFHPNIERFLKKLEVKEVKERCLSTGEVCKILIGFLIAIVIFTWYKTVYILPKYKYNKLHPYTSFIPVLSWILLRNCTVRLRSNHLGLFAWLGKITLETYICQLHVYMQGNAKYLIVLLPGYPLMNFALVTVIYLFLSHRLFHVTSTIGDYLIVKEMRTTIKNVSGLAMVLAIAYAVAFLIHVCCNGFQIT